MTWSRAIKVVGFVAAAGLAGTCANTAARADGYPPFFGYSPYFGSPTTYFTPEDTVHEATSAGLGDTGFGTRTYYRGGPFWAYQSTQRRRVAPVRYVARHPRRAVLIRKD
jgi:hypothetical protein